MPTSIADRFPMIKRLTIIAFFTGAAYVFTVFCLKYLSIHTSSTFLKSIGEIDSLSNLIVSLISAGLLMSAVRNIAISSDWKLEFAKAQQARFTLSLLLMFFALVLFVNNNYVLFLFAPVFALNGDYALYGRSFPVTAAILAFLRVSFPYVAVIVAAWLDLPYPFAIFIASTIVIYILTGYSISMILRVPYLFAPSLRSLFEYLKTLRLGVVSLSYYFIGLGLIPLVGFFYFDQQVAIAFLGIKLYTIFKGVLRIINQSFVREMMDDIVCLKVDKLGITAGLSFLIVLILFPRSFNRLFFGNELFIDRMSLIILGLAGIVSSAFNSQTTKAILLNKDRPYSFFAGLSMIAASLVVIIPSFFSQSAVNVYLAVLIGEICSVAGLIYIVGRRQMVIDRLLVIANFLPYFIIPLIARVIMGDETVALIVGTAACLLIFLVTQYKQFALPIRNVE